MVIPQMCIRDSYGLIQICDVFELVMLEKSFAASVKEKLAAQNLLKEDQLAALDKNSENDDAKIAALVNDEHAEPLYFCLLYTSI